MLVLSRKSQQSVVVGGPGGHEPLLKVTVLEINGGNVVYEFVGPDDGRASERVLDVASSAAAAGYRI